MSSIARPFKRPRTGDLPDKIMQPNVWKDDGNVILEAENTRFRVHWSMLSQHSTVFRDMASLPQPIDHTQVDGCPVIQLSDSAEDINLLLTAMYERHFHDDKSKRPFQLITAFLRLGRKYDMEQYRNDALDQLIYEYPSNPLNWEMRRIITFTGSEEPRHNIIDVINVARENHLFSVLPTAFYECIVELSTEEILDGCVRRDGSTSKLSFEDQRRCILAREKLSQVQLDTTLRWLLDDELPAPTCIMPENCLPLRYQVVVATVRPTPWLVGAIAWDTFMRKIDMFGESFCGNCMTHARRLHNNGVKSFWEAIPKAFDLPGWTEATDFE